ncbi:MAG TPA: 1-deoxy-D-xylulose-5-phosphate reductoisomerase [Actinomycetota bacterium]|nr:1-deoxy-D-xylulose-5-phosphate reductoisomerase [Actinomycetota bacterium]
MDDVKRIALLGSTGSIGTQTLDVVRKHTDRFRVVALAAGSNAELLAAQADEFRPEMAVLDSGAAQVPSGTRFATGREALLEAAAHADADVVVNALVGSAGLLPTLTALDAGKTVALANKESLIAGGSLVTRRVTDAPERLLPVDSEHSAVFQCLAGNRMSDVRRVILTASGGPFRGRKRDELSDVTIEDALAHPTWRMGRKITVDSATLMNKGFEAIEAQHLFRVPIDRVELVVHPRSLVHGIVEFLDGSCIAQLSNPDMRLPLQIALAWPDRLPEGAEPLDWQTIGSLAFEPLDGETFPCPGLAFAAARRGGTHPCVMNAANEEAVEAFLSERLRFGAIPGVIERVLERHEGIAEPELDAVLEAETWARAEAQREIERLR